MWKTWIFAPNCSPKIIFNDNNSNVRYQCNDQVMAKIYLKILKAIFE